MNHARSALVAAALGLSLNLAAQPLGTAFTYQGRLENGGAPANGTYDLRFSLFDSASGGTQIGITQCSDNIIVSAGLFTVSVDFGAQFAGQQRFLEIEVRQDTGLGCGNLAGFTILSPRQPLSAAPNALFASNAGSAASAVNATQLNGQPASFYQNASNETSGTLADARLSSNVALLNTPQTFAAAKTLNAANYANGFVGFGTTTPIGFANFVMSQNTTGLGGMYINTTGAAGNPFYGYSQGGAIAAFHFIDGQDSGKWKLNLNGATRLTVNAQGDVGIGTTSPSNHLTVSQESDTNCIVAINSGATTAQASALRFNDQGTPVWSITKNSSNDLAIREVGQNADRLYISQTAFGQGYLGIGTSSPGATLDVRSTDTIAVNADDTSGLTYATGLQTSSNGPTGAGLFGVVTAASGSVGTAGWAHVASGLTYGVEGICDSPGGYGVYSNGRFAATGTKNFQIDHPLDPENKYLNHYCEEGPEPLNVYRGTVLLDERGQATIELPAYFSEINKDPSYTLTAVGASMPALFVSREIADNRFTISGGVPNGKVCWRVEAARNDRFVRAYGAPVEQDKSPEARGKYLQPALYDQPAEKGQFYRPLPWHGASKDERAN